MKIGTEEFNIPSETKRSLDVEIALLTALTYTIIFAYALDYLSWLIFYPLFHFSYIRFFIGNHDRMHTDTSVRWPRLVEALFEHFKVAVTPWDEPYDSVKRKHYTHHMQRMPKLMPGQDMLKDPHSVYEAGGFWRSLFYCTFFEETQLITDIRNGNITKSRWILLVVYLPLQVLFFMTFGWKKYLGVLLAVRLMSTISWFTFSWYPHTRNYKFGTDKKIPRPITFLMRVMSGKRVRDGFWRHAAHHAWPRVPSSKLHLLDDAVMRNPEDMPEMVATR